MTKVCQYCNSEFLIRPDCRIKTIKFCSPKCRNKSKVLDESTCEIRLSLRFYKNIIISDDCWGWSGTIMNGYGKLQVKNRQILAHRYSWQIHNGPIPFGLHVLHHCDNPPCSNPKHLFLGTDKDNSDDKLKKGRGNHLKGENAPCNVLTNSQVGEIKILLSTTNISQYKLAKIFNVHKSTINNIQSDRGWNHIKLDENLKKRPNKIQINKLTIDQVQEIKRLLFNKTMSGYKISKIYHVTYKTIYDIRDNIIYKNVRLPENIKVTNEPSS